MEWVGKIRIYLCLRGNCHKFCWINLWKDGSLFFGFMPNITFVEYGTAITRNGGFTDHTQTLAKGNVDIKETNFPHVSFHPPRVNQKSGIAHIRDTEGFVDEWELDWFPVSKPTHLLTVYSGNITTLEKVVKFRKPNEIVNLPSNIQYLKANLVIYPIAPNIFHDPNSITKLIGVCPRYLICCYFYQCGPSETAFYAASEI